MIKSLSLTNFKSIGKTLIVNDDEEIKEGKLEFRPLTIFCGKNSSGKSTVLQSILLLTQTLQSNMPSQTLILNGPMVKFGSIDEIKSTFSAKNDLNIKIDIDIDVSKQINKAIRFSPLEENVKRVFVESKSQYYYISNSIDDIKNILNENMNDRFLDLDNKLKEENWILNSKLDNGIKSVMRKHHVDFSARVWRGIDNYEFKIEVHKFMDNKWYSIYFNENKLIFRKRQSILKNIANNENHDNLQKLCITFRKKPNTKNDKTQLVPVINCIDIIFPEICMFKATYRNRPKDIILQYNDFTFYNFLLDKNNKSILWGIKDLQGLLLQNFLPLEFVYLTSNIESKVFEIINNCIFGFLREDFIFTDNTVQIYQDKIYNFLSNNEYKFGLSDDEVDEIIKQVQIPINILFDKDTFMPYAKMYISIFEKLKIPYKLNKIILASYREHNKYFLSELDSDFQSSHNIGTTDIEGTLKISVDILKDFFKNINYIGPLREEPHLQYTNFISNIQNVGVKGENCAAVLCHNERKVIKYLSLKNFENDRNIANWYLNDAVNDCLRNLDIADGISATFNGRYGYELKIESLKKNTKNDLTNVGVGVSQVLPIILSCLLAPRGSIIIIEQPELHLHPAMQSRLTDFFIATIQCGKQVIIETHSEHIINALRNRIAQTEAPDDEELANNVQIYFVDKNESGSFFSPITIDKYAYISDWPDGFFDESQISNVNTLRAINRKLEKDPLSE